MKRKFQDTTENETKEKKKKNIEKAIPSITKEPNLEDINKNLNMENITVEKDKMK
jgi:hypothetical protein